MVKKSGFSAKNVFATSKEHPSQKVKVPNISYETQDPQIARKSLDKAVHDYNKQVRAVSTAFWML